jgi:hypothetical protein
VRDDEREQAEDDRGAEEGEHDAAASVTGVEDARPAALCRL